jgi:hypothetical protein
MSLLLSTSERELYVKGTAVAHQFHRQAAAAEDGEHWLILGKHLSIEPRNAGLSRNQNKML